MKRGYQYGYGILLSCVLVFGSVKASEGWGQSAAVAAASGAGESIAKPVAGPVAGTGTDFPAQWEGLPVRRMSFEGVAASRLASLRSRLPQVEGAPLNRDNLKRTLRQLFATGLYDNVEVVGSREGDGVALVFRGQPRTFVGTVNVNGAKGANMNAQLQRASRLAPGTRFTQAKLTQALAQMRQMLADNGYNEPAITPSLAPHPEDQLVDVAFQVVSGPRTRVGSVEVAGNPGMSVDEFRHYAHLKSGAHVDHDTRDKALSGVLKHYQKQQRLEAEIKLESQQYAANIKRTNYKFQATQGPVVKVQVEGVGLSEERVKRLIPIFEEGTVDEDLLNEGNRRLRDYYQSLGYFDVKVEHRQQENGSAQLLIQYTVDLGQRRRVERVTVEGNRYFDSATLQDLLNVHAAGGLDRHGVYSQALVTSDVGALEAVYQNNGFSKVKVTAETNTPQTVRADVPKPVSNGPHGKPVPLTVVYRIAEGEQQRVGSVVLDGAAHVEPKVLTAEMSTVAGQLLSPQNLAGDRDTLTTEYMSRGFDQVRVDVTEQNDPQDANKVDVVFHIHEGQQIFVRRVLVTGLHYTRPDTIAKAITLHPGDPLNQSALLDMQRNMYEFALFNEVNTAVQNPSGGETEKNILLQTIEARRWVLTYGAGFEAQTGTPQNNCRGYNANGVACNPNGKTAVSPRGLLSITRNNLFGREQSASVQGTYGLLEQQVNLVYQNPHFRGGHNFGLTFTGGYANSQDVTTYVASRLQGGIRWTQNFAAPGSTLSRANTFIYEYNFRRVKVAATSLQVYPDEISELAAAVRVAGPGFTWIRDTRDAPMDAHQGTYTSFQEFLSAVPFGAEASFNRIDSSNSSFYTFDKQKFVLARNTRYAQIRAFGPAEGEMIPLPERLYAGGPTSLRGFPINAAGPRDPETGFPIGGAGTLANSTELRMPPPTLPWLGNTVSFVLFHDMGNVFTNAGDAWVSALRLHQPDRDVCKVPTPADTTTNPPTPPVPSGPHTSTGVQGQCSFNYFSHAPGLGVRYHTPVGPVRLDFSYNLNPPIYPVNVDYAHPQNTEHVGEAGHFNFFFSLGQTF